MSTTHDSDTRSCAVERERKPAVRPADVRLLAMDLLARREHSRRELRQKLMKRFDDEGIVDDQLGLLARENLQSDERYAASFLRQRVGRGYGPSRIRQEMRHKGIGDSDIDAALKVEVIDWFARAKETYQRKFGCKPPNGIKDKAKRSRFMQYRGFEVDHYRHLLDD